MVLPAGRPFIMFDGMNTVAIAEYFAHASIALDLLNLFVVVTDVFSVDFCVFILLFWEKTN